MSSKTVPTTARQQPPAAVAAKSRRRFWANLVVQVSGLLAMLVVAVYSASAQAQALSTGSGTYSRIEQAHIVLSAAKTIDHADEGVVVTLRVVARVHDEFGDTFRFDIVTDEGDPNVADVSDIEGDTVDADGSIIAVVIGNENGIFAGRAQFRLRSGDGYEGDETLTLRLQGRAEGDELLPDVVLTIVDGDPAPGVRIHPTRLELTEGGSAMYGVRLNSAPTGTVTVWPVVVGGDPRLRLDQMRLMFDEPGAGGNQWDQTQSVTVTASSNDIVEGDQRVAIEHMLSGAGSGTYTYYDGLDVADVEVTIRDDDVRGVNIDQTSLSLPEGETVEYSVVLTSEPTGIVTVTVIVGNSGVVDLRLDTTVLEFKPDEWNTAQTVLVQALNNDFVGVNPPVTIEHVVTGADYDGLEVADVTVTIFDRSSPPRVIIDPTRLELTEGGGSASYAVMLNTRPTGMVSVSVTVSNGADAGLELDETVLEFWPNNWGKRVVAVNARRDGRYSAEGRLVMLRHRARGANYVDALADDVEVTILNDDSIEPKPTGIRLSLDRETAVEGEALLAFMVTAAFVDGTALDQDTVVIVTILADQDPDNLFGTVDNPGNLISARERFDFAYLGNTSSVVTIPAGMLSASATLALAITDDEIPEASELLVVIGTADDFMVSPTALQIDDNDSTSVRIYPIDGAVLEGETFLYTVSLQYQPNGGEVQVMVEVTGGREFVANLSDVEGVRTFEHTLFGLGLPTDSQTVRVETMDNSNFGGLQEVTLRHTVVTGTEGNDDPAYRDLEVDMVVLTITDNDRAGIEISLAELVVTEVEEGDELEYEYTVRLLSQPDADVFVEMSIEGDDTLISLDALNTEDALTLLIEAANWNRPHQVIVRAPNNNIYTQNQRVTIIHRVSSEDSNYETQARLQSPAETEVDVLVIDNDEMPTRIRLFLSKTNGEEGDIINLDIVPAWAEIAVLGETEVFLRLNHQDDIASLPDILALADEDEYLLILPSEGQRIGLIIDSGVMGGTGASVQLQINDDDIDEDDEYIVFGGTVYIRGERTRFVSVLERFRIDDNDTSGVQLSLLNVPLAPEESGVSPLDEGQTLFYSLVLQSEPTDNVMVTVDVSGDEGYDEEIMIRANDEDDLTEGGVLIFTSENWNQTQTVTVAVAENNYYRGNLEVTLTHSVEGGDGAYDDLPVPTIELDIIENDEPPTGIQLSLRPTEVGEGSGTVFVTVEAALVGGTLGAETTVLLRTNHQNDTVGVPPETLAVRDVDYEKVGVVSLVIPRSEVSVFVEFSLTVLQNFIDEDDKTIVFGGRITGYSPELDITLDIMTAGLRIADDDEPGLVFLPPTGMLFVREDSRGEGYTLALASEPTGPVNVDLRVTLGEDALAVIEPQQLTFSAGGDNRWNIPQEVSIRPLDNNNKNSDVLVTIQHTASGGGYGDQLEDYTLTIEDDESPSKFVNVSTNIAGVAEEDGMQKVTLTVKLNGSPFDVATSVNLSIDDDSSAMAETDLLSARIFLGPTPKGDLMDGMVTVEIPQATSTIKVILELTPKSDDIDEGVFETIVISGSGTGLDSRDKATIRIIDNDNAGISLSETRLQVAEGGDAVTYTVELDTEPLGNVLVSLDVNGPSNEIILLEPTVFTFSPRNWDSPQTVAVSAGEDDASNDIRQLTITHTAVGGANDNDGYSDLLMETLELELIERSVLISPQFGTVIEGGSIKYDVRLTSEPTSPVTVEVRILNEHRDEIDDLQLVVDGVEQTIRRPTLTFNRDDWKAYQTVTIQTTNNLYSGTNPLVVIEHTVSSAGDYAGVTAADFTLNIDDNEVPATSVLLDLNPITVDENDGDGFATVRLTATLDGPARNEMTTMTLRINDSNNIPPEILEDLAIEDVDFTLASPESSTFALTIPAFEQSATIDLSFNLVNDNVDEGDSEQIVISSEEGTLDVEPVILKINDDDDRGVTVMPIRLMVAEGADAVTYRVKLTSAPAEDGQVTVELSVAYTPVADGITQDAVLFDGSEGPVTLVFGGTGSDNPWDEYQEVLVTLTANDTIDGARDATLTHRVSGADYTGERVEDVPMALTDVDVDLGALEVMTADGETTDLLDAGGVEIEFSADDLKYYATVPFPDQNAFITATPSVTEVRPDEQEKGLVRIFRESDDGTLEALESGADVAGTATEVNLPGDENTFFIVVSARPLPLEDSKEPARQTYTLTLRRALPASAGLQVYLASDADRDTPITTALDFGLDDEEMELILILRGDGNIRYSISGIDISGLVREFADPVVGDEIKTDVVDFETPVTLSRADDVDDDVSYSLTFTATPERPMADANPLSATIEGTLKANTDTRTEIKATYRSHSQEKELPISSGAAITVSDNGPVAITLVVAHSGGGDRPFEQSSFTFTVDGPGEIQPGSNILEIPSDGVGTVTVSATDEDTSDRISPPEDLVFEFSFESPQAVIRPVANLDPLLAFSRPFFAFVGEDMQLPLEVVLADGSTPLANSVDILGGLALALLLEVEEGEIPKTVTIAAGASALPGRVLTFAIDAPRNSVTVEVAVDGPGSEYVEVENLVFTAHFLSLGHDEEIDFRQGPDVQFSKLSLRGENENDDSWSFKVINKAGLADDQYEVIEVILDEPEKMISVMITKTVTTVAGAETTTYTVVTQTVRIVDGAKTVELGEATELDEAEALSTYEKYPEFVDFAADAERTTITILVDTIEEESDIDNAAETRVLRVTRLHPDAEDSRIVLEFKYFLDGRSAGVFTRAIDLINLKETVDDLFTVDINAAPQYDDGSDTELTVSESELGEVVKEYLLKIVDEDGGSQFLDAEELSLQVIGFDDAGFKVSEEGHTNDYFELAFSDIVADGQVGMPNGKRNSLAVTLTLTGVLATPFNSVVELRLFGVSDGFDDFEQYLTVWVMNEPPMLELAMTEAIPVFLEQEPTSIKVTSTDVTDVVVLKAPADLVVKYDYDATGGVITLRRLNIDPANDAKNERAGSDMNVELAALDAQGGRTVVTITVARPPLLPQIMQPNPLLIAAGQSGTRLLQLVKDTDLDVTWTVAVDNPDDAGLLIGDPEIIAIDEDGDDGVSLTIEASAPFGREFNLRLTAVGGDYEWDALLPVVVVAAAARPHLKLSATVSDKMESVSSFALTESLSIGVALEGEVPSSEELGTPPSFQISVFKLDGSGNPIRVEGDSFALPGVFDGSKLEIDLELVGERITALGLDVGDVVEVSIEHLLNGEVSDEIIVGDSLRLRVSEGPGSVDADNDGLADSREGESDPGVLGPITAAVAKVTDSGVELQRDVVSLSLGETSRFLGLGECGRVTLTLTLSEDRTLTLNGCPGSSIEEDSQLLSTETAAVLKLVEEMDLELDEGESYQLIDLSATFDNSEAEPDEALVIISLPVDPQQPHVVYRFDEDEEMWVEVLGAGLPGQPELGGQGALDDLECDYKSCFYALDFDRDGSVQLLLLLVPIDPLLGLEFALGKDHASLEGRRIEISGGESRIIALAGLEGLTVEITGAAIDGGNVTGNVSTDDGTVELIGLKRTRNIAEEVLIEAIDPASGSAVATITLYVRVPNQPPKITFWPEKGKELSLLFPPPVGLTTTIMMFDPTEEEGVRLALAPNTKVVLLVMIEDADDDISFDLELMDNGRGVAKLLGSYFRGLDGSNEAIIEHELTLDSTDIGAGEFEVRVLVTDLSDGGDESERVATLFGCVLDSENQCPAAPPRSRGGGGGGGGGTGLLWLLFAAPAALCRATRLRQRLAARARRASP